VLLGEPGLFLSQNPLRLEAGAPRQGPARVVPLGALMLANFCYVAC
jgi:hypothetical protein